MKLFTDSHIHALTTLTFDLPEGTIIKISRDEWAHCPLWGIEISIPSEGGVVLYDEGFYLCKYEGGVVVIYNEDRDISRFSFV